MNLKNNKVFRRKLKILSSWPFDKDFLNRIQKALTKRDTSKRVKSQAIGEISGIPFSDRGLISIIYKEVFQISKKNTGKPMEKWENLEEAYRKKVHPNGQ